MTSLFKVNIAEKMTKANVKSLAHDNAILTEEAKMRAEVAKLITESTELAKAENHLDLMMTLGLDYHVAEAERVHKVRAHFSHLPQERIFSEDAIRDICIKYNLRFLPSKRYKGALDAGIRDKVEELKGFMGGSLPTITIPEHRSRGLDVPEQTLTLFYIAAPKSAFKLEMRPRDPLLFCQLDSDHYFLVHKWGSDLSIWRRFGVLVRNWWPLAAHCALIYLGAVIGQILAIDEKLNEPKCIFLGAFFGAVAGMIISFPAYTNILPDIKRRWNSPFRD